MKLCAKHEERYISNRLDKTGDTHHVWVGGEAYAFSSQRIGCKVPDSREKGDYLFSPDHTYRDYSTERKSHNWVL